MAQILRSLLFLILVGVAGALMSQNNEDISLQFALWESRPLPVWIFLLGALAVGMVLGGASLLVDYLRLRHALARERGRADEAVQRAEEAERRAGDAPPEAEAGGRRPGGPPAPVA